MIGLEKRKNCLLNGLLDSYILRPIHKKVIGNFSRHKNIKRKVVFAIVALQCQLSARVTFLENFALERKAMTLFFHLRIEVHRSNCMQQEVQYVMTWTKQPHVLQKQFLASVKSKNIPQMETSSNVVSMEEQSPQRANQQLSSRQRGGIVGSTASNQRSSQSRSARSMHANFPGFPTYRVSRSQSSALSILPPR